MKIIPIILFAAATTATAAVDDFLGVWEVRLIERKGEARTEIKYPVRMTIVRDGDHLKGSYTDQFGYAADFSLITTTNNDRDLIFVHAGYTKEDTFSPIHHAKIVNGAMRGICFNESKQFEWRGVLKKP